MQDGLSTKKVSYDDTLLKAKQNCWDVEGYLFGKKAKDEKDDFVWTEEHFRQIDEALEDVKNKNFATIEEIMSDIDRIMES